jgi:uncharacterized protein
MTGKADSVVVTHDTAARRFEANVDGVECELDYELRGSVMTITHTGVPEAVGGRGIAAQLATAALTQARERGWRVVPACSYVAVFIRRNPGFADLLL